MEFDRKLPPLHTPRFHSKDKRPAVITQGTERPSVVSHKYLDLSGTVAVTATQEGMLKRRAPQLQVTDDERAQLQQ